MKATVEYLSINRNTLKTSVNHIIFLGSRERVYWEEMG